MVEKSAQADKLAREVLRVVPALVAERQLEDERLKGLLEQTARARLANYPAALSSFLVHLELGGIPPGWRRRVQLDPLNAITGLPVHEARAFIDAWAEGQLNDETQAIPAQPPAPVAIEQSRGGAPALQEPRLVKKSKLVTELQREWPSIENDLNESSRSELGSAKSEKHGYWIAEKVIQWGRENGRFVATAAPASLTDAWVGNVTRHVMS